MDKLKNAENIINNIERLPSLPQVVSILQKLIDKPDTNASAIGKILAMDPGLSAKVLSLANSAFYGQNKRINNITQAVVNLGFKTIKNLVLTASVYGVLQVGKENADIYKSIWKHSFAVAVAAEMLSQKLMIGNSEEVFACGVLHDVGKLIELKFLSEDFYKIFEKAKEKQLNFKSAELKYFGTDHVEIADFLFQKWGIPNYTCKIISGHHNVMKVDLDYRSNAALIYLADYIVNKSKIGNGLNYGTLELNPDVLKILKISVASLEEKQKQLLDRMDKINAIIKGVS